MRKIIAEHITKEMLLEAIPKFKSLYKIAANFKVGRHVLINTFNRLDVVVPTYRIFSTTNEDFFAEVNEKSAYWAGFLAADGNLFYLKKDNSYRVKLKLARADRAHIEKFRSNISSNKKIYDYDNDTKTSTLIINSKKMFNDLEHFGLTSNKTKTYTIPDWLLNHPMLHHFIRGMTDGDGCVGLTKNKEGDTQSVAINLAGSSPAIKQVYDALKHHCNIQTEGCFYSIISEYGTPFFTLCFRGILDVEKIIAYLYKDATTFLERKKDIATQLPQIKANSRNYYFDPVELQERYDSLGDFVQVAKSYGCSPSTINYQMHKMGLQIKTPLYTRNRKQFVFDKETLIKQYALLGALTKVAKIYSCSYTTIQNAFESFGINRQSQ